MLFCKLTKEQRDAYEEFLKSKEMDSIMEGRRHVLFGIDIVRKICNHPDIVNRDKMKNVNNKSKILSFRRNISLQTYVYSTLSRTLLTATPLSLARWWLSRPCSSSGSGKITASCSLARHA